MLSAGERDGECLNPSLVIPSHVIPDSLEDHQKNRAYPVEVSPGSLCIHICVCAVWYLFSPTSGLTSTPALAPTHSSVVTWGTYKETFLVSTSLTCGFMNMEVYL